VDHGDADLDEERAIQEPMVEHDFIAGDVSRTVNNYAKYLELPMDAEVKDCFRAFREGPSSAALAMDACIMCARDFAHSEDKEHVSVVNNSITVICERQYSFCTAFPI
jgi:hypothetical protein